MTERYIDGKRYAEWATRETLGSVADNPAACPTGLVSAQADGVQRQRPVRVEGSAANP